MNNARQKILAFAAALATMHAAADSMERQLLSTDTPTAIHDTAAPFTPLGIEGNGLLGIEGNGIVQRISGTDFVQNDTLYTLGPGKIRVMIDATAATIGQIQPGHVVLAGARATAVEQTVTLARLELDHLIRGTIDVGGIDLQQNSVSVLGQALILPPFAELADASGELKIEDLVAGDYLRVSGWIDTDGQITVTRVERAASPATTLEISGRVVALDTTGKTLQIGQQTVDYSSAQFVYMAPSDLAIDDRLEVVGDTLLAGGEILANRIRRVPAPLSAQDGQEAELQGYVDTPLVADTFELAGQRVSVSAGTVYERGAAADVLPGRLVEVEGSVAADGTLVASRVEFEEEVIESEIRINATVQTVDTFQQQLTSFGLTVSAGIATRYEDKSDGGTPFAQFSDLEPGTFVEIRGFDDPDGSNTVTATRIIRDVASESSLEARVTANDGASIDVLGLDVFTDSGTLYEDIEGNNVGEAQFIALASVGTLVRVTGTPVPGGIDATELVIEQGPITSWRHSGATGLGQREN